MRSTFDMTYDITFRYIVVNPQSVRIYVDIDDCEDGIYLRWINRHGFYCYWLFTQRSEQIKTAVEENYIRPEDEKRILAFRDDPSDESWIKR